jgi:hypothetical protein
VEQDKPSLGLTPLECAKASIDYLKTLWSPIVFRFCR